MDYKTIVVQVGEGTWCEERIRYACELAAVQNAHLIGLYLSGPTFGTRAYDDYAGMWQVWRQEHEQAQQRSESLREQFEKSTRSYGVEQTEWRHDDGEVVRAAALHARYADLMILGQPDLDDAGNRFERHFPAAVAISAGRPVLVTPHGHGLCRVPQTAIVAWNGRREATVAATAAIPLLRKAKRVIVAVIDSEHSSRVYGEGFGADFALFLSRHDVAAEHAHEAAGDVPVGELLLSRAVDWGADLLVAGAYGHARLREFAFGGVTRKLLTSMTLPVLFAH